MDKSFSLDDARELLDVAKNEKRSGIYAHYRKKLSRLNPEREQEAILRLKFSKDLLLKELADKNAASLKRKVVLVFSLLFLGITWTYLFYQIYPSVSILSSFLALICAYVFVDLGSGIVHALLDHFVPFTFPLIGEMAQDFDWHHEDPSEIMDKSFLELTAPLVTFILVPVALLAYAFQNYPFLVLYFFCYSLLTACIQIFHKWAHVEKAPTAFIRFCQKYYIILPKQQHDVHHLTHAQKNYCLLTGHFNSFLNVVVKKLERFAPKNKF